MDRDRTVSAAKKTGRALDRAFSLRIIFACIFVGLVAAILVGLVWSGGAGPAFLVVGGGVYLLAIFNDSLDLRCPHCGKRVKLGNDVCHHCGRNVKDARPAPPAAKATPKAQPAKPTPKVPQAKPTHEVEAARPTPRFVAPGQPSQQTPPAPAPVAATPENGAGDLVADLERLVNLRDSGALTPEQFEAAKQRILDAGP